MALHKNSCFTSNLLANTLGMALQVILSFWYVRVLVLSFGLEQYGIISVITAIMGYLGIFSLAINQSMGRHMTASLAVGDMGRTSRIASSALGGISAIAIVLVLLGAGIMWWIPSLIAIPIGCEKDVRSLFGLCLAGTMLTQWSIPFGTATFCRNRLDYRAAIELAVGAIRVVGAFALVNVFGPKLWLVGLAIVLGAIFQLWVQVKLSRQLLPGVAYHIGLFEWSTFKDIYATGGWIMITAAGVLLLLGSNVIIINRFVGPREAGLYAPLAMLASYATTTGSMLANLFAPTTSRLFAEGKLAELQMYTVKAVRLLGLMLGIPSGLFCAVAPDVLPIWLGQDYAGQWPLLWAILGYLSINLSTYPQLSVQTAADRVRIPGLITLGAGIAFVFLSVILAGPFGLGTWGVVISGAIAITCKYAIFTPLYNQRILNTSFRQAYSGIFVSIVSWSGSLMVGLLVRTLFPCHSLPGIAFIFCVSGLITATIAYSVLLRTEEKERIKKWGLSGMRKLGVCK